MKIVRTKGGEYSDCIVNYFDLDDYSNSLDDETSLFWGWSNVENESVKNQHSSDKKKIFINTAQPCDIINGYSEIEKQKFFDIVYTICPYTPKILLNESTKFFPICFPYNEKYFKKYEKTSHNSKIYDVIYYGQIHNDLYLNLISSITKFNYRLCTHDYFSFTKFQLNKKITNFNLNSKEKWDLLNKCKISVGLNLIFLNDSHIENLKKFPNINLFENIDTVYKKKIMPQMKTRMVEAALTKTLMLIYKDEWNVIENWFEPNVDFLYFSNFLELENLIEKIIKNYSDYWHIVENANNKVKKYSINKLINTINQNGTF